MKTDGCKCDTKERGVSQSEVQPWHRLGGMEHICELRKSSSVLYSILVTILRMMYSGKKGRVFGCPKVVWDADPEKTGIWIDTELRWEDMRPDFTPAIYVCLGDVQYEPIPSLGMQGRTFMSHDGEQHYERTGMCSASIVHICDKAGESCALADNTENYLSSLQDQIVRQYCFRHFSVVGRTPLRKKEQGQTAGKERIASVVSVRFDWTDAWAVKIESPILKSVDMRGIQEDRLRITGTNVDVSGGVAVIEFGDMSTETDTPIET